MFDVLPTFLDFAGIDPPEDVQLDGKSIVKTVTEGAESPHHQIFWEYAGSQLAIRQGNWKLAVNGRDDGRAGAQPRDPDLPRNRAPGGPGIGPGRASEPGRAESRANKSGSWEIFCPGPMK